MKQLPGALPADRVFEDRKQRRLSLMRMERGNFGF
jgi:hypothetical protein